MDIFTDRVAQGCLIGSIPKRASWRFGGIPRENFLNGIRLLGTKICKGGGGAVCVIISSQLWKVHQIITMRDSKQ